MPTSRRSLSTTGTPLMPRSDSRVAISCTDVSGSTVTTLTVMMSAARMAFLPAMAIDLG